MALSGTGDKLKGEAEKAAADVKADVKKGAAEAERQVNRAKGGPVEDVNADIRADVKKGAAEAERQAGRAKGEADKAKGEVKQNW
jgi:hypothetical protein